MTVRGHSIVLPFVLILLRRVKVLVRSTDTFGVELLITLIDLLDMVGSIDNDEDDDDEYGGVDESDRQFATTFRPRILLSSSCVLPT